MSKREELIREYCRQVNESLHFIQKYMEGIVPACRDLRAVSTAPGSGRSFRGTSIRAGAQNVHYEAERYFYPVRFRSRCWRKSVWITALSDIPKDGSISMSRMIR